jgi:DNA-binding transcriptional LysR family regulator
MQPICAGGDRLAKSEREPMTLDQLVTFQTVCATKSFGGAAETLHLTQPAVSKQIRALELELGERLFERGRTTTLTQAGTTLLKHAEHLSHLVKTARNEIADLRELRRGQLSIGASHTIATHLVPRLIETYRLRYPQVTLSIETGWSPGILDRVLSRDLDLGLVVLISPKPHNIPQLACTAFDSTETVFVASPKDPLVKKQQLTFEEFRKLPLILNHDGCLYRSYLESRFAEKGAAMNIAVEVIGFELEKKLTQLGLGVSLLSKVLVARELKEKSLKSFGVTGLQLHSYSCLVYRQDKYIHAAMRGFLKLLQEAFHKARLDFPCRPAPSGRVSKSLCVSESKTRAKSGLGRTSC